MKRVSRCLSVELVQKCRGVVLNICAFRTKEPTGRSSFQTLQQLARIPRFVCVPLIIIPFFNQRSQMVRKNLCILCKIYYVWESHRE